MARKKPDHFDELTAMLPADTSAKEKVLFMMPILHAIQQRFSLTDPRVLALLDAYDPAAHSLHWERLDRRLWEERPERSGKAKKNARTGGGRR